MCCDCEPATVYNETKTRARKEHTCVECRKTIKAGEVYAVARGLWDGSWSTHKTCVTCMAWGQKLMAATKCHYPFGALKFELEEYARQFTYRPLRRAS